MTLCLTSLVLLFSGVLILVSHLMSLLSSIICCSGFLVILFGLSFTCTPFLFRDVHFCMPLVTDAPMSLSTLFIQALVEVHRSSSRSHGLFYLVFIHRILLHLGLEDFPTSEPVHIIAPIGAIFLRPRVA